MSEHVSRRGFIGAAGLAAGGVMLASVEAGQAAESGEKKKIIAVSCSRREGKNTAEALKIALEAAKAVSPGDDRDRVDRTGRQAVARRAGGRDRFGGRGDGRLPADRGEAERSEGGGPDYRHARSISRVCRRRARTSLSGLGVFRKKDYALSNVVAGVLAVGGARHGGQEVAITSVQAALHCPGDDRCRCRAEDEPIWGLHLRRGAEEGVEEETNRTVAQDLGRRVAEVVLAMR